MIVLFGFFVVLFSGFDQTVADKKIVCYYNTKSFFRDGPSQFNLSDIVPALPHCTHLIYGFAKINAKTYKLESLNPNFDIDRKNYENVINLKREYGFLKIILSIGGNEDLEPEEDKSKYLKLIETSDRRLDFIDSVQEFLKRYKFDGVDLAWEFPETKPKKERSAIGAAFHSLKKKLTGSSTKDDKAEAHREQFTSLVRELRNNFKINNQQLSLTVLPNVNSSVYYNARVLAPNLDQINLLAFDFHTPSRNPNEADYTAPIYEQVDRRLDENIDRQIRYWLDNGAPKDKLVLGLATFGRAWKLTDAKKEIPPVPADGPAGSGLLSFPDVCQKLSTNNPKHKITRYSDTSLRYGVYGYRLSKSDTEGIWIGYEDRETLGKKAAFAKSRGLGGIAVCDLTFDDFRGVCSGEKYPLLKAAKAGFNN